VLLGRVRWSCGGGWAGGGRGGRGAGGGSRTGVVILAGGGRGCRCPHRHNRSYAGMGRERIGRFSRNRRSSDASSSAVPNRSFGALASTFTTIVSRSRGMRRSS